MNRYIFLLCLTLVGVGMTACSEPHDHNGEHDHDHAMAGDVAHGPHGGRVLVEDDFAIEVVIFERGVLPEFRLYPTFKGRALPPNEVTAEIVLGRINGLPEGQVDVHPFTPQAEYLHSPKVVDEPHSFSVKVSAAYDGRSYIWTYDAPEAQVTLAAALAKGQGVRTAAVGPGQLNERLYLQGRIAADPTLVRRVSARFAGLVRSVSVDLGALVKDGQVLAVIEANDSLQPYSLTAPIAGVVTQRRVNPSEVTSAEPLFEIMSLTQVFAELRAFPHDDDLLRVGQTVVLKAGEGTAEQVSRIVAIDPIRDAQQARIVRVSVDNSNGRWSPGQFVTAEVTLAQTPVALVVPLSALQTDRGHDVLFVVSGDRYQMQPVVLGRRDAQQVEVLSGVELGAAVVVENSWLIKADIEKSGAAHDH